MDVEYTGLSYDQVSAMVARSTYCSMEFEYHCKGSPLKCKYGSWVHIPVGLNNLWLHLPVQMHSQTEYRAIMVFFKLGHNSGDVIFHVYARML